jgi:uncharacterized caspase-like protein
MAEFIERIEKAGPDAFAFFYYSGHGAADRTDRGENYLIPVGAKISLAKQLPILGVSLREITKSLERVSAKARFVVIDACRNVGFTKGVKEAAKGFIPSPHLDGIIVAFATRPGDTAEDDNVYASALASILPTPGAQGRRLEQGLANSLDRGWALDPVQIQGGSADGTTKASRCDRACSPTTASDRGCTRMGACGQNERCRS